MEETEPAEEDVLEAVNRVSAGVDRAWGSYCLVMLQKSVFKDEEEKPCEMSVQNIESEPEPIDGCHEEFPSIALDDSVMEIPEKLATNFEEARALFLPGQRHLKRARETFFKLETHCTDYVEIAEDLSALHKNLVHFETDADRKFKIHKRRLELLEEPLDALNESVYLMSCRRLMYELAETYSHMMDAKRDKLGAGGKMTLKDGLKINNLVEQSEGYFKRYLATFSENGEAPSRFPEESERPNLVAYFHLARLADRYVVNERSEEKLLNLRKSLCFFGLVVDYVKRNPAAEACVPNELPICVEMGKLLPLKIEMLKNDMAARARANSAAAATKKT